MKKITGFLLIAVTLFVTTQSCKKEHQDVSITKEITVSLKANESYSYQVPQTGDADDVMQITKQASHALTSKVSPVANSENTLFEYTPASGYTGSDEVLLANVEGSNSNHPHHPHNGNCSGGKDHHGSVIYDFKITITAAN